MLAPPLRLDLGVLPLDLFDQELDERVALVGGEIHDVGPRPVKVVGQEEHLLAEGLLVYPSAKKWVMSSVALKLAPQE